MNVLFSSHQFYTISICLNHLTEVEVVAGLCSTDNFPPQALSETLKICRQVVSLIQPIEEHVRGGTQGGLTWKRLSNIKKKLFIALSDILHSFCFLKINSVGNKKCFLKDFLQYYWNIELVIFQIETLMMCEIFRKKLYRLIISILH